MKEADFLLINNNNTRTKFALANREDTELVDHRSVESKGLDENSVSEVLDGWRYDRAVLASVVPDHVPILVEVLGKKDVLKISHEIELGVKVDFPDPQTIGADRIANAAAVADFARDRQPVIVVDFGTAVTFDIVDPRPAYTGGVIAPGLDSMRNYLHSRTALLPLIDLQRPESAIGKSTEHAMLSGAFHGYRGLVKEIIAQIEKELGESAKIVATGGYADLISSDMPEIDSVEPFLTMDGLRKIAGLNFPQD